MQAASQQIRRMLDRLEEEARREQDAIRRRIDAESAEVKATMAFSRASAVKSVEQEMELRKARETEEARLRSQKEEKEAEKTASPTATKPTNLCSLSLSLPEPELEREDAEDDHRRLLEENRRLSDDNRRLAEEASSLRARGEETRRLAEEEASLLKAEEEAENERLTAEVCSLREQIEEMAAAAAAVAAVDAAVAGEGGGSSSSSSSSGSGSVVTTAVVVAYSAPGSPADGQRPATPSPEEEVSGVVSVSSDEEDGVPGAGSGGDFGVATVADPNSVVAVEGEEADQDGLVSEAGMDAPAPESAEQLQLVLFEPVPSPSRQRKLVTTTSRALSGEGDGGSCAGSVDDRSRSSSSSSSSSSSRGDGFGRGGEGWEGQWEGDGSPPREQAELERLVEMEAERVYQELRADPPPSVKALLAAKKDMDGLAAEARSTLKGLSASVGFPAEQQPQGPTLSPSTLVPPCEDPVR